MPRGNLWPEMSPPEPEPEDDFKPLTRQEKFGLTVAIVMMACAFTAAIVLILEAAFWLRRH